MNVPDTTKRFPLDQPAVSPHVVAWLAAEVEQPEIVRRLAGMGVQVTQQAVSAFRRRHAAQVEEMQADITRGVTKAAAKATIAEKAERIRRADVAGRQLMDWIEAYGLVTETRTQGDDGEVVCERRFSAAVVKALVDLQRYVSGELGEYQSGVTVNDNRQQNVLVLDGLGEDERRALYTLALRGGDGS